MDPLMVRKHKKLIFKPGHTCRNKYIMNGLALPLAWAMLGHRRATPSPSRTWGGVSVVYLGSLGNLGKQELGTKNP